MGASEKAGATYHGQVSPLLVRQLAADIRAAVARQMLAPAALAEELIRRGWRPVEVIAEVPPDVAVYHHPRVEELEPGRGSALVCAIDDQAWPCDHEQDLSREEPDRG